MFVSKDFWVCVDCMMLIANGDTPGDWSEEKTEKWLEQINSHYGEDQRHVCCGDSDLDEEFCVLPCEFCGDALAGARHHCVELSEKEGE